MFVYRDVVSRVQLQISLGHLVENSCMYVWRAVSLTQCACRFKMQLDQCDVTSLRLRYSKRFQINVRAFAYFRSRRDALRLPLSAKQAGDVRQ